MKEIELTQGKVAIVDDEDFDLVNRFKWYALCSGNTWYAVRKQTKKETLQKMWVDKKDTRQLIHMHRFVMGMPSKVMVDHKNHNGLDNRKENLRLATNAENQHNRKISTNNKSGYKGVSYNRTDRVWIASIRNNGIRENLGRFKSPEEANMAYISAAIRIHGEFILENNNE